MKSDTPDSMKFRRLQRRLGISKCQTVGHLELLWLATAKNAPAGDIGRFTNEEIAIECDWEGDHDAFVDSLVECGFLDHHGECRLVVHDWADHCPTYVRGLLMRWGKSFIVPPKESPKEPPKEIPKEPPREPPRDSPTKPSLAKPSQTNLAAASLAAADLDFRGVLEDGTLATAAESLGCALAKRRIVDVDREWIWKHSAVGEVLRPGFVADTARRVLEREIRKPKAFIEKALRDECRENGIRLDAVLQQVPPVPPLRKREPTEALA